MDVDLFQQAGINPQTNMAANAQPAGDLFQQAGINIAPQQTNPSLPLRIAGDIGAGLGQGLIGIDKLINPTTSAYINTPTNAQVSQQFGVNNPNAVDKFAQSAVGFAPYGLTGAPGFAAYGAGTANTNNNNPFINNGKLNLTPQAYQNSIANNIGNLQSQAHGAALMSLISGGLSGVNRIGSMALNAIKPQQTTNQILQSLGSGQSREDNAKSLAAALQNSFQTQAKNSADDYAPVFNKYGNSDIYQNINPAINTYPNLGNDVLNSFDRDTQKLHQQFVSDPTLQNAHDLQSQLGYSIRSFQKADNRGNG